MNKTNQSIINHLRCKAAAALLATAVLFAPAASALDFQARNISVREAVIRLQQQCGISVVMDSNDLDMGRTVSVDARNRSAEAILKMIFNGQDVQVTTSGQTLMVRKAKTESKQQKPQAGSKRQVSGTVTDEEGDPLIGVSVSVGNDRSGVTTDANGNYTISAQPGQTIHFSYIGYKGADAKVDDSGRLDLSMAPATNTLNEVVVVGYGQQKKVNLTGAVSVIDNTQVNGRPVASAANALQGLDPAMNIGINSGRADAGYSINIRGAQSLSGSTPPLVLVDGVEMPLSRINPNDIESVSILKDASASAVYGAKASAGVVLVTTKNGSDSKVKVSYNGRYGWAMNTTKTDYITSGYDWAKAVDRFNYVYSNQPYLKYTEKDWAELEARRGDVTEHPDRPWTVVDDSGNYRYYGNFDWYGYLFRRTRPQEEHNVTLRGGNDRAQYYVSGRYYHADGMMNIINDPFRSYSFRTKLKVNLTNWARFDTNVNYFNGRTTWVGFDNIERTFFTTSMASSPLFVPLNPDGTIVHLTDCVNQKASLLGGYNLMINTGNHRNLEETNDIALRNNLEIDLLKGLKAHLSYAYRTKSEYGQYRRTNAAYSHHEGELVYETEAYFANQLKQTDSRTYRNTFEAYVDYLTALGANNIKLMAGTQYENYTRRSSSVTKDGLVTDELDDFDLAAGNTYKVGGGKTRFKTLGVFGRINYDYDGKYLVELSARADGSSRFRQGHRWGFFPSGSLGWRMSQEKFWEPLQGWWNNAKLRFSVGTLGNQQVDDFMFFDKISTDNIDTNFTFNGTDYLQYASESNPVSSTLTWEKVSTYDAGVDWSFLNSRLNFTADYYIRMNTNMMVPGASLPGVYGVSAPKENAADMRTNGWEVSLRWTDAVKLLGRKLAYGLNASLGDYQTVVTRFNNETRLIDGSPYKGKVLGEIWGYTVDGLFASDEEAAAYPVDCSYFMGRITSKGALEYKKLVGGDLRWVDLDGDNVITRGKNTVDNPGDRRVIGNTTPRYSYTFGGDLNWYGVDMSILFQGIGKRDWYPGGGFSNLFWGPYCRPHSTFISQQLLDQVWSPENPGAYFPFPRGMEAYSENSNTTFDRSNSHYTLTSPNTRYLQSVAYLRFKNLTVGYTLPVLKKHISQLRVYFTGENLYYWSPLKQHCYYIDPEGAVSTISNTTNSGEVYNFPKTFSVGVDITF